jgi:hypothetical protein
VQKKKSVEKRREFVYKKSNQQLTTETTTYVKTLFMQPRLALSH